MNIVHLIKYGPDNQAIKCINSAIYISKRYGYQKQCLLSIAIDSGRGKMVEHLLKRSDYNVNLFDRNMETPLLVAVRNTSIRTDIVEMLLDRKDCMINVTYKDKTPLIYASTKMSIKCVELLLKRKDCKLDICRDYRTALYYALHNMYKWYLRPNIWSLYGKITDNVLVQIVKLLLYCGSRINKKCWELIQSRRKVILDKIVKKRFTLLYQAAICVRRNYKKFNEKELSEMNRDIVHVFKKLLIV